MIDVYKQLPLILFMRHGQAENNVSRTLVGRHIESHLTEYGRLEVLEATRMLKDVALDLVFTSPVIRTVETAKIICQELGMNYVLEDRLYEIELGSLAGQNYEDVVRKYGNLFLKYYNDDPELSKFGIESFASVKKRINHLLVEMLELNEAKNILMVTHLDPVKAVLALMLELNAEALYKWHIHNASMTILKHQSKSYTLHGVNVMGVHRYQGD